MSKVLRQRIALFLLLVGLSGLVFGLCRWLRTAESYAASSVYYHAAARAVVEVHDDGFLPEIDFEALKAFNEDAVGWLFCPDTALNYPVVQGTDNIFYLDHLLDESEGVYGTLFLDSESSPEDRNMVIYGHHMKDGSMLACLLHYQEQNYYEEHPAVYYITPEQSYEVRLFAGFETGAVSDVYNRHFVSADFGDWLKEMCCRSDFQSDYIPDERVQVMTLSTCAYSSEDARYVVMGALLPL